VITTDQPEQYVSNLTHDQVNGVINLYVAGQMTQAERACRELLKIDPQSAMVLNVLGAALQKLGQLAEAVKSFEKAIQVKPDYAEAYYNYGTALQELGQLVEAVKSFEKAIKIKPDFAIAYDKRGNALQDLGRLKDAMKSYDMAIQIKPDFPNAYSHRGIVLHEVEQWEAAVKSYDRAIQLKPDYAEAHYNRGIALQSLGQLQEAMKSYEKAIQIRPDYVSAYSNLGRALQDVGQLEEAMKSFEKAIQVKPDFAEAYHHLSMQKEFKPDDAQIGIMESLYADSDRSEFDHKHLCFALANVYDDLGEYDKGFSCLAEGNRLRKKELNYNIDDDRKLMTRIKEVFTADTSALELAPDSMVSIQPLFIVGMLRSGTSLVEQILACHSQVHGAGELVTMWQLAIPILSILSDQNKLSQNDIKRVHDGYLEKLTALNVPEKIITDKTPHNFLWIGFILSAFPGAKIIHLNRDPKAICWSIYKRYFSTKGHGYANDLVDLAEFYKLYIDLMSFWRERFPNAIYDLCYEDLTESQEEETRKLLAFCDLQWEKQCLDFHQNTRVVQTMSAAQVRKKMYQGSSEAWKKYAAHLQPLVDGLG
jgi:tetratricopeptide (TPR) repeat protein